MNKKIIIFSITMVLFLILSFPYLRWRWHRWVNYSFDYQSQVEETIHKTVKKECLINP